MKILRTERRGSNFTGSYIKKSVPLFCMEDLSKWKDSVRLMLYTHGENVPKL